MAAFHGAQENDGHPMTQFCEFRHPKQKTAWEHTPGGEIL